jgi:hypothetical protein
VILIPEIETTLILVPRTGTSSLIKAVTSRYPDAMRIYRHMEADGIPDGYEHWRKVGIVRDPLERLWSLYNYLQTFDGPYPKEYIDEQRKAVQTASFVTWLLNNQMPFTQPYDSSGKGKFFPRYNVRHNLPETRKSQYMYLRPDLGTEIFHFSEIKDFAEKVLKVSLPHINASSGGPLCEVFGHNGEHKLDIHTHLLKWFSWDLNVTQPDWAPLHVLRLAQKAANSYGR